MAVRQASYQLVPVGNRPSFYETSRNLEGCQKTYQNGVALRQAQGERNKYVCGESFDKFRVIGVSIFSKFINRLAYPDIIGVL